MLDLEQEELISTLITAYRNVAKSDQQDFKYSPAFTKSLGARPRKFWEDSIKGGSSMSFQRQIITKIEDIPWNLDHDIVFHLGLNGGQLDTYQSDIDALNLYDLIRFRDKDNFFITPKGFEYFKMKIDEAEFTNPINQNKESVQKQTIFIGHGRNPIWLRLSNFLEKELELSVVAFESESRVGESIVPVLEKMLDEATFAILVLTAEDATTESDKKRARQNVIHEVGLFQGRLGFKKAIVLKQDNVEEFSNIAGLQYISFSGNNIQASFYEIQKVLKREGLLS